MDNRWRRITIGIFAGLVFLLLAGGFYYFLIVQKRSVQPLGNDKIQVSAPLPGALVQSPLKVTGQARGTWYFEASFPVKLVDANGQELAAVPAQAQGDWMTQDFVPFEAKLNFTAPPSATGFLILEKDNPSGLPQNADSISIPVRFR